MEPWTLTEAHRLAKAIREDLLDFGFEVAVGGNVLYRGLSRNEIELYFIPVHLNGNNPQALVTKLAKYWGKPKNLGEGLKKQLFSQPAGNASAPQGFQVSSEPYQGTISSWAAAPTQRVVMTAPPPVYDVVADFVDNLDGPEEVRREIQEEAAWEFQSEPMTGGVFRYRLRFYRDGDTIEVNII